jgi:hypothetical protein
MHACMYVYACMQTIHVQNAGWPSLSGIYFDMCVFMNVSKHTTHNSGGTPCQATYIDAYMCVCMYVYKYMHIIHIHNAGWPPCQATHIDARARVCMCMYMYINEHMHIIHMHNAGWPPRQAAYFDASGQEWEARKGVFVHMCV